MQDLQKQVKDAISKMTPRERQRLTSDYKFQSFSGGLDEPPAHDAFAAGAGMAPENQTLYAKIKRLKMKGMVVNLCRYVLGEKGCHDSQLDQHGYCRHLVGFTTDGKRYEPLRRVSTTAKDGTKVFRGRFVQLNRKRIPMGTNEDGEMEFEEGPPELPAIQENDQILWVTTTGHVYRDLDTPPKEQEREPELKKGK